MRETRETFAGLATWEIVLWYGLIAVSTAIFAWGVIRLVRKYRRGRGGASLDRPPARLGRTAWIVLSHAWIRRRAGVTGVAHAAVFYGFVVLFIGTAILAFQDDIAKPLFGWDFWHGAFYLGYSLFLDAFGAALLVGLLLFAIRRGVVRPPRLSYARVDREDEETRRAYVVGDWVFLATLAFLGATGFLLEALRIAQLDPSFERWSPLGWVLGQGFISAGLGRGAAGASHHVFWWVHGLVALAFVSAIPFTKAVHMLTSAAGIAVRDEKAGRRLVPLPAGATSDQVGYQQIADLSPQHLLSLDACTKCGKCHEACPATASGEPLSPRDLVLDLREVAEGSLGIRAALGVEPLYGATTALGEVIRPETLWSCMTCMACVEICPVGIEHVPIIIQLRRGLVERGEMDSKLQATLETIYTNGNSFGEQKRKRAQWARGLPFQIKDARKEPVDLLWFVGDYAALDARNQQNTRALARILHHAEVEFGLLYDAEKTAGNDVRRVGEEGLFLSLAEHNLQALDACSFNRILTSDPHTYNTLKNEYPELGASWTSADVVHHSELLLELLQSGILRPRKQLGCRVTYHDPCALGRYNGVYEQPRAVLSALGLELVEMPRNRDNSFCCGAGGGRIWMKEPRRKRAQRPSENRIDEAVSLGGIDYFVVACPKDVTMYEDAIKTSGHQGDLALRELSELVLEALALDEEVQAATGAEPGE